MSLISILEAGRRDFLDATSGIASNVKPRTGWSAVDCIEHVVAVEERHLDWISAAQEIMPARDVEREIRLFSIMRSRLTKIEAPEGVRPYGRFTTLETALAEFKATRDRSVRVVRELGDAIYSIGTTHPYFGDLNGAELIQLVDGHTRRHAEQIREIVEGAA